MTNNLSLVSNPVPPAIWYMTTRGVYATTQSHMQVMLSPTFGSFMQPKGDVCPICVPHPNRIRFDQDSHGTSLMLAPNDNG